MLGQYFQTCVVITIIGFIVVLGVILTKDNSFV